MDKINRIRENIGSVMIGMEEVTDLRLYRDIRGMTADWIMQLEEMASSETDPFNSPIIPEELRELGGNHPTPVLLIYLGWLLTGAVLLFTLILIIRLVIEYIHQFQEKKTEENGDIAVSLEEDAAVRVRRFVSSRRAGRNLPAACETPTQIEEGTSFPDDYDVERLHEAYAQARYGKPAQNSSS